LISKEAIRLRQAERTRVLAQRFLGYVKTARTQMGRRTEPVAARK
jgi:hypothetical protein